VRRVSTRTSPCRRAVAAGEVGHRVVLGIFLCRCRCRLRRAHNPLDPSFFRFFPLNTNPAVPPPRNTAHRRTSSVSCSGVYASRTRQRSNLSLPPGPPGAASPCEGPEQRTREGGVNGSR
jgi:hypothetical protein